MTLIPGLINPAPNPGTHVLAIGVGHYANAFTPGATDAANQYAASVGAYSVTSPPLSARAVADWFLTDFHNPLAPLGSIELLLSEPGPSTYNVPGGVAIPVAPADFTNVSAAFLDWEARCNTHSQNVAVFYFSGHAAESANRVLLPSDFPSMLPSGKADWTRVVNFNATRVVMEYCLAEHQFFFLDCCRTPIAGAPTGFSLGVPLSYPALGVPVNRNLNQFVYTIPVGMSTGAERNRVSSFTDLLLHSVRGAGAERRSGGWRVSAMPLLEGCNRTAEAFGGEEPDGTKYPHVQLDPGVPYHGNSTLHHYPPGAVPVVPTVVRCQPIAAAVAASYSAVDTASADVLPLSRHPTRDYAHHFLKPGHYRVQLAFPPGTGWVTAPQALEVEPPVCELRFQA